MKRVCSNKNSRCIKEGNKHISMYLAKKQNNTTKMMKKNVKFNVELAKECFKHGEDVLWIGDDVLSNPGTFMKEEDMRKNFFPLLKWQVKEI